MLEKNGKRADSPASKRKMVRERMSRLQTFVISLVLVAIAGMGQSQAAAQTAPGGDLEKVLAQLDAASAKFKSAQADFSWDAYQAVVQEHDVQTGEIYFEKRNGETRMAGYFKPEGGDSAAKVVVYDGGQLQFYQPSIKQMQVFRAGANSGQYESFITLGFGGSGSDLKKTWNVTLMGKEAMNGFQVVKLDLKPKAQNVQNMFSHVTVWLDPARGVSLKQIFYQPSGDQRICTYTNIKYNQPVSEGVFHIKTAPGTTIQRR